MAYFCCSHVHSICRSDSSAYCVLNWSCRWMPLCSCKQVLVSTGLPIFRALSLSVQAAYLAMSHVGGKLLLFQAGRPSLGVGRVRPSRENSSLYDTDREATLRNPEDPFFKRFAGESSSRQITVDIFCAANGYTDLASLSSIAKYTCGQVGGQQQDGLSSSTQCLAAMLCSTGQSAPGHLV